MRKPGALDRERKKILSPAHKRQAVTLLVSQKRDSVQRACLYLNLRPRTYRYQPIRPQDRHARLIERWEVARLFGDFGLA